MTRYSRSSSSNLTDVAGSRRRRDLGIWVYPIWLFLALGALTCIYPIAFILFTALKSDAEYLTNKLAPPAAPTLENFAITFEAADLLSGVINSLVVVSSSVVLLVGIATLAAHSIRRMGMPPRVSGTVLALVVGLMMMPKAVLLVPVFKLTGNLGMFNSYIGLILVYLAFQLPAAIYLMSAYYETVPPELVHAAQVDGASDAQIFRRIAIPLLKPGMKVTATLNFLWLWNELLFALLLLPDLSKRTLMVTLAALRGQHTTPIPNLSTALLIGLIVPILIFAFAQRGLAEGLTQGALK